MRLIDADALLIKIDEANYTAIDIKNLIAEAQTVEQDSEPVGWIYEDELPSSYPYDAMFPFSKVDMVRMFPVYLPKSPKRKWRGLYEVKELHNV